MLSRKNIAFTLAEVLVTLGIIGVVSAMTVPSLIQNYQRQSYVTQLHKVYNEVQQASLKYLQDHNAINLREAGLNSRADMSKFLNSYFKVINDCEDYIKEPCFASSYRKLNGTTSSISGQEWNGSSSVMLASGASILIDNPKIYKVTVDDTTSYYGHMLIDINGPKGPNIIGRDFFYAEFYDDGSIDGTNATPACKTQGKCNGASLEAIREANYASCQTSPAGQGCIDKIINDGWQMNY